MKGEKFTFTKGMSNADTQTVGKYIITVKGDLVLVYKIDGAPMETNKTPVAFFRATGSIIHEYDSSMCRCMSRSISTIECAGDKIAVGCRNGEVLHLRAAFLVT